MGQLRHRYDVRWRAVLITGALVIAGGLFIAYVPDKFHGSLLDGSSETRAAHVREKTEAEIKRRFERGVAMLDAKEYAQALAAFHRVLELSPEMPEAHVNAGFALIGMGRYSLARDFFEGALALRKDQVNAYYGLAEAMEGLNDLPGALGAMRTYLHLAPQQDPYRRKAESAIWEWESKINEQSQSEERDDGLAKQATHKP
ncbi:MAG: tetratricopeptide repeat protein [Gallionellaceae bacterium]